MTQGSLDHFVAELRRRDIKLAVDDQRLRCDAPKGVLTPDLQNQIKHRKAELIEFLRSVQSTPPVPLLSPAPPGSKIPLSYAQEGAWFINQLQPGTAFNISWPMRFQGPLDMPSLEQTLDEIVRRHAVLRTNLATDEGQPLQVVHPTGSAPLELVDLSGLPEPAKTRELLDSVLRLGQRPFELAHEPLAGMTVFRLAADEHLLQLVVHHTVFDGWSISIFARELAELYGTFRAGRAPALPPLSVQYSDYALWQRTLLQGEFYQAQVGYWRRQLADHPPSLEIAVDHAPSGTQLFRGDVASLLFPAALREGVRQLAQREGVTQFMLLLAAFQALLSRTSGQDDLVVGTPFANRNQPEMAGVIGFCVNILALRTDLSGNPSFRELLSRVREVCLGAYSHQELPFGMLVRELHPSRDVHRSPIFQVQFALHEVQTYQLELAGLRQVPLFDSREVTDELLTQTAHSTPATDHLFLNIVDTGEHLGAIMHYRSDLFEAESIRRMLRHLQALLEVVVANADCLIQDIPILGEHERRQLLVEWNRPVAELATGVAVQHLFEAQVRRTPDAVAVQAAGEQLSYEELNRRANRLARYLKSLELPAEARVGICVDRSLGMIVAVLGVLKSGAAYVPLDPAYSRERLSFMLADARVQVLLTQQGVLDLPADSGMQVVQLDRAADVLANQDDANLDLPLADGQLAYVIYTSGSTGRPKGVMVSHGNVVNAYRGWEDAYELRDKRCHLQMASFSFDVFGGDLVRALGSGGTLALCPRDTLLEPENLYELMQRQAIDSAEFVPAVVRPLLEYLETNGKSLDFMKLVMVGSDAWYGGELNRLRKLCGPQTRVVNSYGVAEATIDSTFFEAAGETLSAERLVPIGRPFTNTQVYVLDPRLQPAPIGVQGELYLGGAGVSRGYLDRPELTAEKFIPHPFSDQPGARLYRTGDRARYLADGNIEFLGRVDNQIKIRGFRIEPGEIETVLGEHPAVRQAVVVGREDEPGNKRLIAYVVGQSAVESAELRQYLQTRLPDYMVPAGIVILDELPLSPNGKVDRRALPAPQGMQLTSAAFVPPTTDTQRRIAAVWCEVLKVEAVGLHDNFFDLGGHSLLLVEMRSKLREVLGEEISILDLFQFPTIDALAGRVAGRPPQASFLESIRARAENQRAAVRTEDIAIIGMSGCFPGAKDIDQFWRNLRDGVESISFFTDEELQAPWIDPAWLRDPRFVKARGVLEDVELFDAAFFGYTPAEAEGMDPQHRLFLERGWEALESAGYDTETYRGAIGVFAGVSPNSYLLSNLFTNPKASQAPQADKDFLPTRLSYKLNLRGPGVCVQTACSTSLVAVCQACQSLLHHLCDIAVAGGASIAIPMKSGYGYQEGGIVSPDGHCRAFDAQARGFVPGSGVGVVVLKRLSDAIADGDSIAAVIKGFAVNNDGSAKVGYMAPSIDGQAEVVALAQALAGIPADSISYIEAHGTGTELGDPIEMAALTQAFRASTNKKGFCAVGSLKTNIGHLDAAAGVAGLIKTVLALKHKQLPASLHFTEPNPKIDFANSPFFVNAELRPWENGSGPRRAGVSAFGIGGTNAHVILEESPVAAAADVNNGVARPCQLLVWSAKTDTALDAATGRLGRHLSDNPELDLADVANTLQVGRQRFAHRRMLVCESVSDAAAVLQAPASRRIATRADAMINRQVVFMFPGQGAQHVNMGRHLYEHEALFRDEVDRCCQVLQSQLGLDLRSVLYPAAEDEAAAAEQLKQTSLAQPALFTIEYALARLWMSWGVQPAACIGHSIGEYVAACLAEVLELDDALRLVAIRGRLMEQMPAGSMLAVHLAESDLQHVLSNGLCLAAVNGPALCVLSGSRDHIGALEQRLGREGVACQRLHTSHAFHSTMMDPILKQFERAVRQVKLHPPKLPYISNLTGTWIERSQPTTPEYWSRHLRQTVRFSQGLGALVEGSDRALLEVGPGTTLAGLARQHPDCGADRVVASSMRHPQDPQSDTACLLNAAGSLWLGGVSLVWRGFHNGQRRRRIPLPTYPFERQRYWLEQGSTDEAVVRTLQLPQTRHADLSDCFYIPAWKRTRREPLPPLEALVEGNPCWLVFEDDGGLGRRTVERLAQTSCRTVSVEAGDSFQQLDDRRYAINPCSRGDYAALLKELEHRGLTPNVVVHLWGVSRDECRVGRVCETHPSPDGSARQLEERNFHSLTSWAQGVGDSGILSPLRLVVVANGVWDVTGEESIVAEKSLALGPCLVFPQEYTNVSCRHIDVGDDVSVDQLIAEIARDSSDDIVAFRRGNRWVQVHEPARLETIEDRLAGRLKDEGVYLITGGLGGIGLEIASCLATTAKARLALVGRRSFPARAQWMEFVAVHGEADVTSRKIRQLEALEHAGGQVLVCQADVCNEQQMRHVIQQVREQLGPIHGVIHAAGIALGGITQLKSAEAAEQVFAPKVEGLRVLRRVLAEEPPAFVGLCSSLSAIVGGVGLMDYAAANAFLDATARQHRTDSGTHWFAINWPGWHEVGMAVAAALPEAFADRIKEKLKDLKQDQLVAHTLSNREGIDALRRILAHSAEAQVAVSLVDLPSLIERQRRQQRDRRSQFEKNLREAPSHPRPELPVAYVEPQTKTEQAVAEIWQQLFGYSQIGTQDGFFELGGHSLLAIHLVSRLNQRFGVNLPIAVLFEHNTVGTVAGFIDAALWAVSQTPPPEGETSPDHEEFAL